MKLIQNTFLSVSKLNDCSSLPLTRCLSVDILLINIPTCCHCLEKKGSLHSPKINRHKLYDANEKQCRKNEIHECFLLSVLSFTWQPNGNLGVVPVVDCLPTRSFFVYQLFGALSSSITSRAFRVRIARREKRQISVEIYHVFLVHVSVVSPEASSLLSFFFVKYGQSLLRTHFLFLCGFQFRWIYDWI